MGTRNLTMVVCDGKMKVAQYGQWDGYPDGQGVTILNFLSNKENITKLKDKLKCVRFLEPKGKDKELVESYDKNAPVWSNDPDNRTEEQKSWFENYINRDIAGEILEKIANSERSEIILRDHSGFIKDSLFCEWAYLVDLDKNTFEVYEGYQKEKLPEDQRFYSVETKDGYYPCKMVQTFNLDNLPNTDLFLRMFQEKEEE